MGIIGSFEGYTTSPIYLYNNGSWSGLQTTGVSVTRSTGNGCNCSDSGTEITFKFFNKNANGNAARLNSLFDVTNYKYMKVNITSNSSYYSNNIFYVGLSKNITAYPISTFAAYISVSSGMKIIDISSVSGSYYVSFMSTGAYSDDFGNSSYFSMSQIFFSNT